MIDVPDADAAELANAALSELQAALNARALYPHRHPHVTASEDRARSLLERVLEQRDEVSAFAVEERVIVDGRTMPASRQLVAGLFGRLRRHGADRVTFRRGLGTAELREFLDRLADSGDGAPPTATPHLAFGYICAGDPSPGGAEPPASGLELPQDTGDVLDRLWEGIRQDQRLDLDTIGDVVSSVSKAVANSGTALLPLAALKRHDEYTFTHTINVAILSTALGEALGFKPDAAHELNMAALLHDVGKKAIPDALLNKAGKYTDEEFRRVQLHPVEGARMLFNTPGIPDIAPVVAYEHHIRADLSGYPKVPPRWRLSLASRIVQIADVFDALRTHRPYRKALPLDEIAAIMGRDVGHFFDADLLHTFFDRVVTRGVPEPAPIAGPAPPG